MAKLIGSGKNSREGNSWTVYLGFLILYCITLILSYNYIETIWGGLVALIGSLTISFILFKEDATTSYMWIRVQLRKYLQTANIKDVYGYHCKDIPNLKKVIERKKNETIR